MATPAPMDSGRYLRLVRLVSCLKRIPERAVMSSNRAGCAGGEARRSLAAGAAPSILNKNERRFIRECKAIAVLREPGAAFCASGQRIFVPGQYRPGVRRPDSGDCRFADR